jgi:DNA adenine methylase
VSVRRPVLRWHGGKWKLAPWIIAQFPPHRTYVEPFGGAASVLLRKRRTYAEIYNDLDGDVVNLFRVLRDPELAPALISSLELTPFARDEFDAAYEVSADPVEEARRLVVRSFQGFGSDAPNRDVTTGFRANAFRNGTTPAADWQNFPHALRAVVDRLRGVVIENRPALDVLARNDAADTLHYVDPPYMPETRSAKSRKGGARYHAYRHEMTLADHQALVERLCSLSGMVVLSGYPSVLYDDALADWTRVETAAFADGARPRREVLWISPNAQSAKGLLVA